MCSFRSTCPRPSSSHDAVCFLVSGFGCALPGTVLARPARAQAPRVRLRLRALGRRRRSPQPVPPPRCRRARGNVCVCACVRVCGEFESQSSFVLLKVATSTSTCARYYVWRIRASSRRAIHGRCSFFRLEGVTLPRRRARGNGCAPFVRVASRESRTVVASTSTRAKRVCVCVPHRVARHCLVAREVRSFLAPST